MKFSVSLMLMVLCLSTTLYAQKRFRHQGGLFLGFSSYAGDVSSGLRSYMPIENLYGSLRYSVFINEHLAARASISSINFRARDSKSLNEALMNRNYNVFNSILELFVGGELNFFRYNPYTLYNTNRLITPYFSSGLALISFPAKYIDGGSRERAIDFQFSASIPLILGAKFNISKRFIMSVEASAAYAFTDNLDGSNPSGNLSSFAFGNLNDNDWYFNAGVGISYIFAKPDCHCLPPLLKKRPEEFEAIEDEEAEKERPEALKDLSKRKLRKEQEVNKEFEFGQ